VQSQNFPSAQFSTVKQEQQLAFARTFQQHHSQSPDTFHGTTTADDIYRELSGVKIEISKNIFSQNNNFGDRMRPVPHERKTRGKLVFFTSF
jgi:hypothetical protein